MGRTKTFESLGIRILDNSNSKDLSGRRKNGEDHRGKEDEEEEEENEEEQEEVRVEQMEKTTWS